MIGKHTIGGLARAVGVPTSTVRYYERRGLVRSEARSRGNYRLYGPSALERLRFVRSAQAAGFTLSDIELLLRYRDGDPAPCREVQGLITKRLTRVVEQIKQLRGVETMLQRWLGACRRSERTGKCGVLDGLARANETCREKPVKRP